MVSTCPRTSISEPRTRLLAIGIDDPVHLGADARQVAAIHRAENVDGALDVVMVHHGHAVAAADGGDVVEDFRRPGWSHRERQVAQRPAAIARRTAAPA